MKNLLPLKFEQHLLMKFLPLETVLDSRSPDNDLISTKIQVKKTVKDKLKEGKCFISGRTRSH